MVEGTVIPVALLTIKQAAKHLAVSLGTVYDLCAQRKLKHLRVGTGRGTIRIRDEDLDAYMNGATVPSEELTTPQPRSTKAGNSSGFKNLDGDRLLAAWRQQGVLADRPDGRSAPSSASSCDPSAPLES